MWRDQTYLRGLEEMLVHKSLCDWQPVFRARGLLGMNVVSVTLDPASC